MGGILNLSIPPHFLLYLLQGSKNRHLLILTFEVVLNAKVFVFPSFFFITSFTWMNLPGTEYWPKFHDKPRFYRANTQGLNDFDFCPTFRSTNLSNKSAAYSEALNRAKSLSSRRRIKFELDQSFARLACDVSFVPRPPNKILCKLNDVKKIIMVTNLVHVWNAHLT